MTPTALVSLRTGGEIVACFAILALILWYAEVRRKRV